MLSVTTPELTQKMSLEASDIKITKLLETISVCCVCPLLPNISVPCADMKQAGGRVTEAKFGIWSTFFLYPPSVKEWEWEGLFQKIKDFFKIKFGF